MILFEHDCGAAYRTFAFGAIAKQAWVTSCNLFNSNRSISASDVALCNRLPVEFISDVLDYANACWPSRTISRLTFNPSLGWLDDDSHVVNDTLDCVRHIRSQKIFQTRLLGRADSGLHIFGMQCGYRICAL